MSRFLVYVASPYADARNVLDTVHPALVAAGLEPSSTWTEEAAKGPEQLDDLSPDVLAKLRRENYGAISRSDAVLVFDPLRRGRETYAEMMFALMEGTHVVFLGPPTLSATRPDVRRVDDLEGAIRALVVLRDLQ